MKIPRYERTQGIQTGRLNALIDETPADVKAIRQFGAGAQEAGQDFGEAALRIQAEHDKVEETRQMYAYDKKLTDFLKENVLNKEGKATYNISEETYPKLTALGDEFLNEVPERNRERVRQSIEKLNYKAYDQVAMHEVAQMRKAKVQAVTDSLVFSREKVAGLYSSDDINDEVELYVNVAKRLDAPEATIAANSAQIVIAGIQSLCDKQMYGDAGELLGQHRKLLQSVGMAEAAENDIIQAQNRAKAMRDLALEDAREQTEQAFVEKWAKGGLTESAILTSNLTAERKKYWIDNIRKGGGAGSRTDRKYRNELVNRILADPESVQVTDLIDANADGYISNKDFSYLKKLHADELKNSNSPRRASLKVVQQSIKDMRDNGLLGKGVKAELLEQKLTEDLHTWYGENKDKMPSEWFAEVSKEYYSNCVKEWFGFGAKPDIERGLADRQSSSPKKGQTFKEYRAELEEKDYLKWKETFVKTLGEEKAKQYTDEQFRLFFKQKKAKK